MNKLFNEREMSMRIFRFNKHVPIIMLDAFTYDILFNFYKNE